MKKKCSITIICYMNFLKKKITYHNGLKCGAHICKGGCKKFKLSRQTLRHQSISIAQSIIQILLNVGDVDW
jgi:hypothetical protein